MREGCNSAVVAVAVEEQVAVVAINNCSNINDLSHHLKRVQSPRGLGVGDDCRYAVRATNSGQ